MVIESIVFQVKDIYCIDNQCMLMLRNDSTVDESLDHVLLDREYILVPEHEIQRLLQCAASTQTCSADATYVMERSGYGGNTSWELEREEHPASITLRKIRGRLTFSIDELHE